MNIEKRRLAAVLSRNWGVLLVRGISAILFGVLAWLLPGVTLAVLAVFFAVYILLDGILGIWTAFTGRKEDDQWWVLLFWGIIGVGIGVLTFLRPGITAMGLLLFIAIWAVTTGILEIVSAIRLRKEIKGEWLLILGGIVSVLFGIFLMVRPMAGALSVLWLIATYAIIFGVIIVVLAFKVRSLGKKNPLIQPEDKQLFGD